MWYCVAGLGEEMADGDDGQVEREYSIIAVDVTENVLQYYHAGDCRLH